MLLTHGSPKLGYYQYWIFWIELLVRFTVCLQHSLYPCHLQFREQPLICRGKLLFLLGRLLRLRELRRRFRVQGEPQRNLAPRPLLLFLREEVVFQLRLVAWQGLAHLLRTIARHCLGVFL